VSSFSDLGRSLGIATDALLWLLEEFLVSVTSDGH